MELNRPVLVGHSYGGAVALAYAIQFPNEIAGVVALAPPVLLRSVSSICCLRGEPRRGSAEW
jgi:pimeloyl-ACP methyl ester carboxylesterase